MRAINYSAQLVEKVLQLYITGETLQAVLAMPGHPKMTTFFRWLREHDECRQAYERAREARAERFVDDLVSLADEAQGMTAEGVSAMKLRIDTRKWVASKFFPRQYADRLETGAGSGAMVGLAIVVPLKELPGATAAAPRLEDAAKPLIIDGKTGSVV